MKRIIALVLVLCVLVAGALYVVQRDRADQRYMRQMYSRVEPLQQQIDELERQKKSLQQEYDKKKRNPSTVQLLVRELSANVFEKVYPIMRTHGVTGVLGVSLASRPVRSGNYGMTIEQYNRLLLDGWGSCLIYDGRTFDSYIRDMELYMNNAKLPMPTAIYFPNGYDEQLQQTLLDHGITTVIVNAMDGHSNTVTEFDPIWITGAMPWNYTGVMSDLDLLAVTEGGNLTFTLSTSDILDKFEAQSFGEMMDKWYELITDEENDPFLAATAKTATKTSDNKTAVDPLLAVATYENARTTHETATQYGFMLDRELQGKLDDLNAQIESITAEIQDIYTVIDAEKNKGIVNRLFGN